MIIINLDSRNTHNYNVVQKFKQINIFSVFVSKLGIEKRVKD